ncbi:thiamine phosphate synthase [Limisalsivibrio acetivorans]|uniref:thiamine phosphate synthase n=1 Tax=Limisalsivibrio acetivorans TaxID=1304888 RepID=UPI0003B3DD6B|nr:thiamine phosphate synthase [Limisalsivibrio acetivorans]
MRSEDRQKITDILKLYLVYEEPMLKIPPEEFIPAVIRGGVTCIQLRSKELNGAQNYRSALSLRSMLEGTGVPLIINDRADIALCSGADGVHVGAKDIPPSAVRGLNSDYIIGYSCNTPEDVQTALSAGVDYIGTGPAFPTDTKKDLRELRGPSGIGELIASCPVPAIAIGGITAANCGELCGLNLKGVAVSSSICASEDPERAAAELREMVEKL